MIIKLMNESHDIPRKDYPRPQWKRENWYCLNGYWDFAFDFGKSGEAYRPVIDASGGVHGKTDMFDVHDYEQDPEKLAEYLNSHIKYMKESVWQMRKPQLLKKIPAPKKV